VLADQRSEVEVAAAAAAVADEFRSESRHLSILAGGRATCGADARLQAV
jgi:hypothetical protein